jgi:hypothetical protein
VLRIERLGLKHLSLQEVNILLMEIYQVTRMMHHFPQKGSEIACMLKVSATQLLKTVSRLFIQNFRSTKHR